jgi:hypothetical protein
MAGSLGAGADAANSFIRCYFRKEDPALSLSFLKKGESMRP